MPRGGKVGVAPSREVQISKKLSWLLRHGALKEGLNLERGGYVNLGEVLANRNLRHLKPPPTLEEIKFLVDSNEKQRFSLVHVSTASPTDGSDGASATATDPGTHRDSSPSNYLIRANQGHSFQVDDEGLLTRININDNAIPDVVVHGTRTNVWPQIVASGGLKKMRRNHVHFATGVPATLQEMSRDLRTPSSSTVPQALAQSPPPAVSHSEVAELPEKEDSPAVLSGMRTSSNLLIFLDLKKALGKGLEFSKSENGVVLSAGDERGIIGLEFFERVEDLRGKRLLVENGKILVDLQDIKA